MKIDIYTLRLPVVQRRVMESRIWQGRLYPYLDKRKPVLSMFSFLGGCMTL